MIKKATLGAGHDDKEGTSCRAGAGNEDKEGLGASR